VFVPIKNRRKVQAHLATLEEKPFAIRSGLRRAAKTVRASAAIPVDIITCEFPPTVGGVADYTQQVANALSEGSCSVRVWGPGSESPEEISSRLTVNRSLGRFGLGSLMRAGRAMRARGGGRCLVLEWEPVGYGMGSVNLIFCLWIVSLVLRRARLVVMFHETFLDYSKKTPQRLIAATLQRLMAFLLVNFASRVFASTAGGAQALARFSVQRDKVGHLPVFSNVKTDRDPDYVKAVRASFASEQEILVGHFGRYMAETESLAIPVLRRLLLDNPSIKVLFAGECAGRYRAKLLEGYSELEPRVHSAGIRTSGEIASVLAACDLMFQPYPDGITTRRSTAMAALANGRFLVSNLGPESEDLWMHNPAVCLLAGRNAAAQADEISRIVRSPELMARGSISARRFYEQNFSLERTLRGLKASIGI
jgi:glycosyltransferase involved in cell wall biosynthesis